MASSPAQRCSALHERRRRSIQAYDEESMLDQAFDVKNNSRLSCQIELSEELDGLEIEIAPE